MNIRPFTDALRAAFGDAFVQQIDSRGGGVRTVVLSALFTGQTPFVRPTVARAGDRWVTVQLWGDHGHRVSHAIVTRDCDMDEQGPRYHRASTFPTSFREPHALEAAVRHECAREDHPNPEYNRHTPMSLEEMTSVAR